MLHYAKRLYRHTRDFIDYLRAFKRKEYTDLEVLGPDRAESLFEAKRLHARIYLDRGFIKPSMVDASGIMSRAADPHQAHSEYFIVASKKTGKVVAVARQIGVREGRGHKSFPLMTRTDLYERSRATLANYDPKQCVEISALVKERGASKIAPLLLYRAMWHHSLQERQQLWFLSCDVRLFARLKLLFGPAIQQVGRRTAFPGGDVVPAIWKVQSAVSELSKSLRHAPAPALILRRMVIRFLLKGLPEETLSAPEKRALAALRKQLGRHA